MTLKEAIEILGLVIDTPPSGASPDFIDAQKLGIEAQKEVKRLRSYKAFHVVKLLPGETEE